MPCNNLILFFTNFDAVRHLNEAYQRKGVFQKLRKVLFPFSGTNRNTVFMKYEDTSLKNTFLNLVQYFPRKMRNF